MGKALDILVCDDCAEDAAALAGLVSEYGAHAGIPISVTCCQSPAQAREHVQTRAYDALLLDVYLEGAGGETGIDLARSLRADGYGGAIVFTTVSPDHVLDAYGVNAVQYLLKPVSADALANALSRALADRQPDAEPSIVLAAGGQLVRISLSSFVCSETRQHYQHIATTGGMLDRVRMSCGELFAKLGGRPEFVRVGASFIVNLQHVVRLDSKELVLSGGLRVPVPRGARQQIKERYFAYYLDGGE